MNCLRLGRRAISLHPFYLVSYDSSIFGPDAVEASDSRFLFIKNDWAAVALNYLELPQSNFVIPRDTDEVWERVIEASRVQLDRLVVY